MRVLNAGCGDGIICDESNSGLALAQRSGLRCPPPSFFDLFCMTHGAERLSSMQLASTTNSASAAVFQTSTLANQVRARHHPHVTSRLALLFHKLCLIVSTSIVTGLKHMTDAALLRLTQI